MKLSLFGILTLVMIPSLRSQHVCGTDHYYEQQVANNESIKQVEAEHNLNSKKYVKSIHSDVNKRAASYTIPVVFHVIHTGGNENISREQILDQIRILNEDFSYTNKNKVNLRAAFKDVAASGDIEFKLATIDPSGNCFDGINRIYSPTGVDMDMSDEPVKDLAYWNYRKYLNIWVVTNIESGSGTGTVLGYAVFPWTSNFNKDGIVIRHDRVGSIGTASNSDDGRTLTHEVGHWLGLYHTFQGGCNDGDNCDDTPPVSSTFTNANCPANGNSCSTDFPDLPDMWENYMDYSNGTCMSAFTKEQVARMHYYLQTLRSSIYSSSNLISVGVQKQNVKPTAAFNSNTRTVCAGKPVTFYDLSCRGEVTARLWTFQGALQSTSTEENPSVIYNTPGTYEVKLQVENNYGSDVQTQANYIKVLEEYGKESPNFEEGFENGDPIADKGFQHLSPTYKFDRTNSAAYTGNYSFRANINSSTPAGSVFSFQTPSFEISALETGFSPKFTFWASYAQPNADISETLKIYISTDCGGSWEQIYQRNGSSLAYLNATYASNWKPTLPTHWRRHGLGSLSSLGYGDAKSAIFRIDVISAGGNPVYIDNINLSPYFASNSPLNHLSFKTDIFPNPTSQKATLSVISENIVSDAHIALYDVTGRLVSNIYDGALTKGKQEFEVKHPTNASVGVYYIRINTTEGSVSQRLIFENE